MFERDRRAMLAMLEMGRDEGPCAEHCASSFRRRPVEPQGQHDLERGRRVLPPANVAAARVGLARPRRGGARRGRRVCRRGFGAAHAGRLRRGRPPGLGETGERHVSRFRPGGRRKRGGRPEREALAQPPRRRHRDDCFELVRRHGSVRAFRTFLEGELGASTEVEISAVADQIGNPQYFGLFLRDVTLRAAEREREPQAIGPPEAMDDGPLEDSVRSSIEAIERKRIVDALAQTGGNRTLAAKTLRLSRQSLHAKLKKYRLGRL